MRDRWLAIKKGPSAKLGPDGDSGGHGAPSAAIQADQADFSSTYRALRLRFKVKGRQHLGTNGGIPAQQIARASR